MSTNFDTPTPTREPAAWEAAFLAAYSVSANATKAAALAGIDRTTAYVYRKRHPEFGELMDAAYEQAVDALEAEAWRRACEGNEEFSGIDKQGEPITYRRYSDTLMVELLRGHRPKRYRQRLEISMDEKARKLAETLGVSEDELLAKVRELQSRATS